MEQSEQSGMLSVADFHAIVGRHNISKASLYAALKRGDVPHWRLGNKIFISRAFVEKMLEGSQSKK
jgi:hypothetical protein